MSICISKDYNSNAETYFVMIDFRHVGGKDREWQESLPISPQISLLVVAFGSSDLTFTSGIYEG